MKNLVLIISTLSLCSCASWKPRAEIMPREDGTITALYKAADKDQAEKVVLYSANDYCAERKLSAVFLNDTKNEYTGKMDEETRNNIRKASKVGMVLGGVGMVPNSTRGAGTVLGTAGTVGTIMTSDKDYKSEVKFKCK